MTFHYKMITVKHFTKMVVSESFIKHMHLSLDYNITGELKCNCWFYCVELLIDAIESIIEMYGSSPFYKEVW